MVVSLAETPDPLVHAVTAVHVVTAVHAVTEGTSGTSGTGISGHFR